MDQAISERPVQVTRAVLLLCASVAIRFVAMTLDGSYLRELQKTMAETPPDVQDISKFAITFSLIIGAGLLYAIYLGKNWARIAYLLLFGLGLARHGAMYVNNFERSFFLGASGVVTLIFHLIAFWMLFGNRANAWYKL